MLLQNLQYIVILIIVDTKSSFGRFHLTVPCVTAVLQRKYYIDCHVKQLHDNSRQTNVNGQDLKSILLKDT